MDRNISARFYRVVRECSTGPTFSSTIKQIWALPESEREAEIDENLFIRLANVEVDGDFICGQIIRKQVTNIPPKVGKGDPVPLDFGDGEGLAHRVAFRFHPKLSVLLLEHNNVAASTGRLNLYISQMIAGTSFDYRPVLTKDAWDRMIRGNPRKIMIKVGEPDDLSSVESPQSTVLSAFERLKEVYGGATITITVAMERKQGSLKKDGVRRTLKWLLGSKDLEPDSVKMLKLDTADAETGESLPQIDFLQEQMGGRTSLTLSDKDPLKHYVTRKTYLKTLFSKNWNALAEQYSVEMQGA